MSESEPRPYGRRAFLGLLAGGLTSFWWAGPVSRVVSPLTSQFSQLAADVLPVGGWRIYTITGTMPDLDRVDLDARGIRAREEAAHASRSPTCTRCRRRTRSRRSTA